MGGWVGGWVVGLVEVRGWFIQSEWVGGWVGGWVGRTARAPRQKQFAVTPAKPRLK